MKLNKIELILSYFLILFYLLIIVVLVSELFELFNDPKAYSWVYHFNLNDKFWNWNYFRFTMLYLILSFVGIFIAYQTLKNKTLKWRIANLISTISMLLLIGIKYYLWYLSGYDH